MTAHFPLKHDSGLAECVCGDWHPARFWATTSRPDYPTPEEFAAMTPDQFSMYLDRIEARKQASR